MHVFCVGEEGVWVVEYQDYEAATETEEVSEEREVVWGRFRRFFMKCSVDRMRGVGAEGQ
jgi:hypothetical protein